MRRQRVVAFACLLAVLGFGAWALRTPAPVAPSGDGNDPASDGAATPVAMADVRWRGNDERVSMPLPSTAVAGVVTREPPAPTADAALLEVRVTQDRQPLAGAVVHVWHDADDQRAVARGTLLPAQSAVTDRDGLVHLDDFRPRRAVLAAEYGSARVQRSVRGSSRSPRRHELELGTSALTGTVHDAAGAPGRGAIVMAYDAAAYAAGRNVDSFVGIAGADGSFQMSGLPALSLAVHCDVDTDVGGVRVTRFVTTAPERLAHVRFGRTPGAHRWRGRVVDAEGQPVPGHQRLVFLDRDAGERRELHAAVDGSFVAILPAGRWDAKVGWNSHGQELPYSASARLDADHTADLVLPGLRLLCRLVPSTPTTHVRLAELAVSLHRGGTRLVTRPPVLWNGEYWLQWVGLEPDSYVLRSTPAGPGIVPELGNGRNLALHAGASALQLDLVVR